MTEAVVIINTRQRIVMINQGAELMFGYRADELIGAPLDILLPEPLRTRHAQQVAAFAEGEEAYRTMAGRPEIQGRRRDGQLFRAEAVLTRASLGEHCFMAAVVHDLSDLRKLRLTFDQHISSDRPMSLQNPVGIAFFDNQGYCLHANPTVALQLGVPHDTLHRQHWRRLLQPAPDSHPLRALRTLIQHQLPYVQTQTQYLRPDGSALHARLTLGRLETASDAPGYVALIEDTSMQRWRELGTIIDHAANEVYVSDTEGRQLLFVNATAARNLGYSETQLAPFSVAGLTPPDAPMQLPQAVRRLRRLRAPRLSYRSVHQRRDGSSYPVRIQLQPTQYQGADAFLAIAEDISSEIAQERALQRKNRTLELIAATLSNFTRHATADRCYRQLLAGLRDQTQSAFAYLCLVDNTSAGKLRVVAIAAASDTLRTRQADDHSVDDGQLALTGINARVVMRGISVINNRAADSLSPTEPPDNCPPVHRIAAVPVHSDGQPVGMIAVVNANQDYRNEDRSDLESLAQIAATLHEADMQARHEAELEQRLHRAERMKAVGQLTGGIAHDFNNLLLVIQGNAEQVEEATAPGSAAHYASHEIIYASERAADLTRGLLAFARRHPMSARTLALNDVFQALQPLLRRSLGEAIDLHIATVPHRLQVHTDRSQLESALLNLALNARDAMPGGGRLGISATAVSLDQAAAAPLNVTPGDFVRIAVEDEGHGIPASALEHIFEPFFTTKATGKGSGMGLAMVYGFARQSGGHVGISSSTMAGTTIALLLPLTRPSPEAEADAAVEQRLPRLPHARVLVVEDDANLRRLVTEQLTAMGLSVCQAEDARTALRELRTDPGIDLLFTDIVMPGGVYGTELARQARQAQPGLKVLLTSGYPPTDDAMAQRSVQAFPLLLKPYRKDALHQALLNLLGSAEASAASK